MALDLQEAASVRYRIKVELNLQLSVPNAEHEGLRAGTVPLLSPSRGGRLTVSAWRFESTRRCSL